MQELGEGPSQITQITSSALFQPLSYFSSPQTGQGAWFPVGQASELIFYQHLQRKAQLLKMQDSFFLYKHRCHGQQRIIPCLHALFISSFNKASWNTDIPSFPFLLIAMSLR